PSRLDGQMVMRGLARRAQVRLCKPDRTPTNHPGVAAVDRVRYKALDGERVQELEQLALWERFDRDAAVRERIEHLILFAGSAVRERPPEPLARPLIEQPRALDDDGRELYQRGCGQLGVDESDDAGFACARAVVGRQDARSRGLERAPLGRRQ